MRRTVRCSVILLVGMMALGSAPPRSWAVEGTTSTQTFKPAVGADNLVTVDSSAINGSTIGALFDFARRPRSVFDTSAGQLFANNSTTAHLLGSVGITHWLGLSMDLPAVLSGSRDSAPDSSMALPSAGLGDLRVGLKLRLLNNESGGFGIGILSQASFPTHTDAAFRSDVSVGTEQRLILDLHSSGRFFFTTNLGFYLSSSSDEGQDLRRAHQLRYGLGMFLPFTERFGLAGELAGAAAVASPANGRTYSPLELSGALRYAHRSGLTLSLGGGGSAISAPESPQFRLFAGLGYQSINRKRYHPPVVDPDPDRDEVLGTADRCPEQPGPIENDGCPDTDEDGDGLLSRFDRCPEQAGPPENDGCPDADADHDGVIDRLDRCPDKLGVPANSGCPDTDTDNDSVLDRLDRCPDKPGPVENNGCPDTDADQDTVVDRLDRCPDKPGPVENKGCPDTDADHDGVVDRLDRCPDKPGPANNDGCALLEVVGDSVRLVQPIQFAAAAETVEGDRDKVLTALLQLVAADATIKKLRFLLPSGGAGKAQRALASRRVKALGRAILGVGFIPRQFQIKPDPSKSGDTLTDVTLLRARVGSARH